MTYCLAFAYNLHDSSVSIADTRKFHGQVNGLDVRIFHEGDFIAN